MKLKNFKIKKYTLTKLHLLKCQAYKTNINFSAKKVIDYLERCLKQVLKLIYFYHINNKKILFVGFPYLKNKMILLKSSNHMFLPKKLWVNGSFSNNLIKIQTSPQKSVAEKKNFSNKDFDLVVFFNATFKDIGVLKELSCFDFPLIILGGQISTKLMNNAIFVPLIFKNKNTKKFCSFLVYSILKKSTVR